MLDKYINNFKKNGYLIKKTNDNKSLNYLQKEIHKWLQVELSLVFFSFHPQSDFTTTKRR